MPLPTPLKIPPGAAPGLPGGSAAMGVMPSESLAALAQLPGAAMGQANKKQRELYVGNLPVGMVTPSALRDLFSQPLKTMPNFSEAAGQVGTTRGKTARRVRPIRPTADWPVA